MNKKNLKKGPSTRERIVVSALDCFISEGVLGTNISTIAKRLGIPHPLVLYHYPTLQGLYLDMVLFVVEDIKDATLRALLKNPKDPKDPKNPKDALCAYVRAPFQWAQKNRGKFSVLLFFYYQASFSKPFMDLNTQLRQTGRERISTLLYEGIAKGKYPKIKSSQVEHLALEIQSLITGGTILSGTEHGLSRNQIMELTVARVMSLLG